MSKIMMMLGAYPFMLDTAPYTTLKRTHAYRWKKQDRIGRKPAQQFLGPDAGQIKLSGEILPHWKGGYFQLDAMRAQAGRGKPFLMVDGRGFIWGDWVIRQIEETNSEFFSDGTPRVIKFSMSLAEYGEDQGGIDALALGIAAVNTLARLI